MAESLGTLLERLARERKHRFFVVDDQKNPIGVVTLGDVVGQLYAVAKKNAKATSVLPNRYSGKLTIFLRSASNLSVLQTLPLSTFDPFVTFKIDNMKVKSSAKEQTDNPVWNETFTMKSNATSVLKIHLWDRSLVGKRSLAKTSIALESFQLLERPKEVKVNLSKNSNPVELVLDLTYIEL